MDDNDNSPIAYNNNIMVGYSWREDIVLSFLKTQRALFVLTHTQNNDVRLNLL